MKQTNNAIKFLMAQYRAIFKNAYFKGMASAVLLTAGLAAGQAQAADIDSAAAWEGLSGDVTVDGTGSTPNTTFSNLKLDATSAAITATNNNTVNITITSGATTANYIKGASSNSALVRGDNVSITLNLDTAANGLAISGAASSGAATLDISKFAITKGTLSLTGAAAGDAGAATLKADTIVLGAANASDAKITFATGNTDAGFAVLEGRLTNANGGTGTLDFTGFGTLKTYTDDNGANVDITVATSKGATLDLSEQSGKTFKVNSGTIKLTGNDTVVDNFTITNGTLELGSAAVLTDNGSGVSGAVVKLNATSSADEAVLKLSADQLTKYLSNDQDLDSSATADNAGNIDLTMGTIELTDSKVVLSDVISSTGLIDSATTVGNGNIKLSNTLGNSVIKGQEIEIKDALGSAITKLTVQADKITLTEKADDGTGNHLGVGQTIAANYDVKLYEGTQQTPSDDAYTVSHEMGWLSTTEINNPYHVANNNPADPEKITVAANGTIGHDYIITSGAGLSGDFHIMGGHYTDANDIELKNGGKLTVGGATAGQQGAGIDASLTLTSAGSLTLNNKGSSGTNNEITIAGNAAGTENWHNQNASVTGDTNVTFTPESVLDLSQGTIKFAYDGNTAPTDDHEVQTNITVGANGELIVTDDQMDYLLNNLRTLEQRNAAVSGAAINLSGGTVTVKGDLNLDIDDISTTADTGNKINFDTTGGILAADNIVIEENESNPADTSDSGTALDLGANGTLNVNFPKTGTLYSVYSYFL